MIRINLIAPEAARVRGGKSIFLLYAIFLLGEAGGLFFFQSSQEEHLTGIQSRNSSIDKEIARIKKKTAAVVTLEAEKEELEKQKAVLNTLVEGQDGPVKMLDELSRLLSPIEDPEEKLRVDNLGWNINWDPKRLWIDSFIENERAVKITGHARNYADASELVNRMESSKHFIHTKMPVSEAIIMAKYNDAKLIRFQIESLALYGPADVRRLASGELGKGKKKRRRRRH